ncbi:hypothetical protein A9Q68_06300 [Streptococcus bovimastitidis]|uniref:DUF4298 domain-containing protein n=1 Tax=Streptococcus bovimastitidis TaxID=1856638 RepID=A0A1L8MLF2_9STRE|nr:DUF4298 domain-containing protein [Streptococcus bovimastitidis]OJF71592.1 hypothetical protein A9Q68_06300 [Streptococcus bovimastitidis]
MTKDDRELIENLEKAYDYLHPILEKIDDDLDAFENAYQDYLDLRQFHGSTKWFDLFEEDHDKIKSGILSQDQLYNLIVDHNHILGRFFTLSERMYKKL